MPNFAYRCPDTGLVEWANTAGLHKCVYCGEEHQSYPTGPPEQESGPPNITVDKQRWCPSHGKHLTRKAEEKADDVAGLAHITRREAKDMNPEAYRIHRTYGYRGQRRHGGPTKADVITAHVN